MLSAAATGSSSHALETPLLLFPPVRFLRHICFAVWQRTSSRGRPSPPLRVSMPALTEFCASNCPLFRRLPCVLNYGCGAG